jgi:hypothetical protein
MRRKYGLLMGRMSYDERADRFDAALAAARSRSDADKYLPHDGRSGYDGREWPLIAEALGQTRGSAGSVALRSAMAEALAQLGTASPALARPLHHTGLLPPRGEGKTREYYWFGRPAGCATVRGTAHSTGPGPDSGGGTA